MRLRLGRPDLTPYQSHFDLPDAASDLAVTWGGVSTVLFDDGRSQLMTDGFFTRLSLPRLATRKIAPDESLVADGLARLGVRRGDLAAVIPVHSHFDHAMDSGVVVRQAGGRVVGGTSSVNVGRGAGLDESQVTRVSDGDTLTLGTWQVTFIASEHCPPDRFPGEISEPLVPPARMRAWKCGEAWSLLVEHGEHTALVQGSAGFVPGSLTGRSAEVVYLGVGQLGVLDEDYIAGFWEHTVRTVGARRVVLLHWDDFFVPLDQLRALPYAGDDLDVTMRLLRSYAARDGVSLHLPRPWHRHNPWD